MTTKTLTLLAATAIFATPLLPLTAQAEEIGLTGNIGTQVTVGSGDDDSANATTDASVGTSVTSDLTPIIITNTDSASATNDDADVSAAVVANDSVQGDENISSSDALRAHAKAVATSDAHIDAVSLSGEKVSVSYREPARLFGVIQVQVPVTVTAQADGTTHISYPWYSFLLSTDQAGLSIRAKAAVDTTLHTSGTSEASTANANAKLSFPAQARLLDSIHIALKSTAEASTSASVN